MYHIAIVDDDNTFCALFNNYLENVAEELHIEIHSGIWNSGEDLYQALKEKKKQDIIFLDIELVKNNGIWLGNMVREKMRDYRTAIVYISHEKNYAMQLFETQPIDFLVKPVRQEDVRRVMKRYLDANQNRSLHFTYQKEHKRCSMLYEDILYFRSMGRKVEIVTLQDGVEFYGKLGDISDNMPENFIQIHKSYLVNTDYIHEYAYEYVIMQNGERLSISKPWRNLVQETLFERER